MSIRDIPAPTCATCGEAGSKQEVNSETTFLCSNCGTEMRFMPAGELLHSGGSKKQKEFNGWVTTFSVHSSELYYSRVMFLVGILILVLSLAFLGLGKVGVDAVLWSGGSGILLSIVGRRKEIRQKKKTQTTLSNYPYWQQ